MKRDDDIRFELEEISRGFPEPKRYKVPDSYFEQTPDRIMSRWGRDKHSSMYSLPVLRRMIAAAALVGGIALGIVWVSQPTSGDNEVMAIRADDAYQYIHEHIDEFESLMLEDPGWMEVAPMEFPDADAVEEYLLEELQAEEIESLF